MAGPIIVEGPDGQEYEFPEGTAPDVMKQAMRKRYGGGAAQPAASASPFLQRAEGMLPAGTQPVFPAGAPATGKQAALDARNERITAAQRVQRTVREQTATERDLRVKPVEEAAARAGKLAKDAASDDIMANPGSYALGGGFRFNLGRDAEQEVYDEAGVVPVDTAYAQRGINSTLWGVPGIVSKEARARLAQAGEDQPGAALAGDLTGIVAGGSATWGGSRAGVNALARPLVPQGADAASRGVRYLAPLAGQTGGVALQNAAAQAGVFEPIRAEQSGEDLTIGGMADAAARGLKDPFNALPVGLSAVNRTWNALTTGIATGADRAADMANRYGVGPRQTSASQGIAQTTQQLGGQLRPGDIRGLTNIENALRFALRDNPNIPDVNARIADGFQRIRQSLPLEDDPTLNLARLIEREFADDAPQTRDIIRRFLSKVGQETPGGEAIVGGAANDIRGRQADVLEREAYSVFGDQPKQDAKLVLEQNLDLLGEQTYAPIVRQAQSAPPQAQQRAAGLLNRRPETEDILFNRADREGLTVQQYIARNPLEALHWVQSDLAKQARALRGANNPDTALEGVIQNMKTVLRDNVPNYREADALYASNAQSLDRLGTTRGADAGTQGELKYDPGFGERLLGPGGASGREEGRATARTVFDSMDEQSRRAAAISVRDIILDDLGKARAAGVNQRYEIAAKFQRLNSEGALQALVDVFGEEGRRIVNRIRQFVDANEFASAIDPMTGSNTMNKAQNMATGAQPFASGMGQTAQGASNALSESAIADSVLMLSGAPPIISAMRAPGIIGRMLQPGQRTQRNIAETLLRRGEIGSQVPPLSGGPPPIRPIDPSSVPGGGSPPAGTPPSGGAPPPQVPPARPANALAGQRPVAVNTPIRLPTSPPRNEQIEWTGPVPREPPGLLAFIRKLGGIREDFGRFGEQGYMSGTVRQILGDARSRPGLLNNKDGQTIDELARSARDAGYDIGDDEDFVRQLADELQGRGKSYRIGEAEEWNAYQEFLRDRARNDTNERVYDTIPLGLGAARGDLTGAAYGAGLGGIAPADSAEERARNMAIGAGLGGVAGRIPVRSMGDDVARTAGVGGPKTPARIDQATNLPLNEDGTVTIYHATKTKEAADEIRRTGVLRSAAEPDVYVSTAKSGTGYGDHVVAIDVDPKKLILDDEFPDGRMDFRIDTGPSRQAKVRVSAAPNDPASPILTAGAGGGRKPPNAAELRSSLNAAWADSRNMEPKEGARVWKAAIEDYKTFAKTATADELRAAADLHFSRDLFLKLDAPALDKMGQSLGLPKMMPADSLADRRNAIARLIAPDVQTMGVGGGSRKPPKPDSPEAIKAALKDITKPKKEPTRLARMVEEGKDASVPPANTLPEQDVALTAQAKRMEERGLSPIEIYDQTGVAMVPYNGGQVPIISPKMGPEELTRVFYGWLAQPVAKRPEWVKEILARAPRKKGLMLRDKAPAPQQPNALAEPPLPNAGIPGGAIAGGALLGAATGIPAGAVIGTMMARDQDRKRNALAQ